MAFQDWFNSVIRKMVVKAFGGDYVEDATNNRQKQLDPLINYFNGQHKRPLKKSGLGKDYNVISNHVATIVNRSVSMLVGGGVDVNLPGEGDTEQKKLIQRVMDANKWPIFLHDLVQFGSIYGTPAIKIIPNGKADREGNPTFRLVALNPYNLTVFTQADDIENVLTYCYRWNDGDVAMRELTTKNQEHENEDGSISAGIGWTVTVQKFDKIKWVDVSTTPWPYEFAPISHTKNLTNAGNIYGKSDIEDILELQDRYNDAQSNVNKILSLQAFAQLYITGGKLPRVKDSNGHEILDVGADKAIEVPEPNAKIGLLEPSGDLSSSRQFVNDIRRDMFDIAATVDVETVKDKAGQLTNFTVKMLYKSELAKNATKQMLYGDLLLEVINHILQLAGYKGAAADPGKIVWGNPLPENDKEEIEVLTAEKALGIVSDETIAGKRDYDWKSEQERMAKQKKAAGNVGANILRDFLAGK